MTESWAVNEKKESQQRKKTPMITHCIQKLVEIKLIKKPFRLVYFNRGEVNKKKRNDIQKKYQAGIEQPSVENINILTEGIEMNNHVWIKNN
jgi:hypothetical protein